MFQAADWWSLGVLTYELLTGLAPFASDDDIGSSKTYVEKCILKMEPRLPKYLSPEVSDLICRLMEKNPQYRLGAGGVHEIKTHCFFRVSAY